MNVRKSIDYGEMYAAIDKAMARDIPQMELYCEIGKIVCARTEKGAAVAAAEYLRARYPDVRGFSPRNLRRMRDFYRMYANEPKLLAMAMELNWTQNVVIMEADLTMVEREWYLSAVHRFGWSKAELIEMIEIEVHKLNNIDNEQDECERDSNEYVNEITNLTTAVKRFRLKLPRLIQQRCRDKPKIEVAKWPITLCLKLMGKPAAMRF